MMSFLFSMSVCQAGTYLRGIKGWWADRTLQFLTFGGSPHPRVFFSSSRVLDCSHFAFPLLDIAVQRNYFAPLVGGARKQRSRVRHVIGVGLRGVEVQ